MIKPRIKRKLRRYIKECLNNGISEEKIVTKLIELGWKEEIVKEVLSNMRRKPKRFNIVIDKGEKKEEEAKEEEPKVVVPEVVKKESIRDRIEELDKKMDMIIDKSRVKQGKPFRLPHRIRGQLKTLAKKRKIFVILLRVNRSIDLFISKIERGFIEIDGKWHKCTMDFVFLWKGLFPCVVIPEWDLCPIGTKDYYDAIKAGRVADPQDIILRLIESIEAREKKKLNPKALLWIGFIVIALLWLVFGGTFVP